MEHTVDCGTRALSLSSEYKRENVAYRVNMLVFASGIYLYMGWVIMTQSGWSIQWITEHFRHPTEEGSFACYPDLTIIFRIFLGHSIYEEIMSIKMNASWVWHIHAIISIVLCSGAFISPLEATVVLMLLEVTGIPLAIATIADAMGYNGVAAVSGMCFAAVWFIFRLCLFTPYVVFYLCRTHRSLVATSADLSDSMKL